MYNDAKSRLQKEIKERQETIKEIDNFDNLDLHDKFETIKKCFLRYERDTMPDILKNEFKSSRLKGGDAYIDTNYFIIYDKNEDFTFSVSLSSYNHIEIENENELSHLEYRLKESIRTLEITEDSASRIKRYLENPSIDYYKEINYNKSKLEVACYIEHFIFRKKSISKAKDIFRNIDNNLSRYKAEIDNIQREINKEKETNEIYLKDINKDIRYFEDKGYEIKIKF